MEILLANPFLIILFVLFFISLRRYMRTRKKGYLAMSVGLLFSFSGGIVANISKSWGLGLAYLGHVLIVVGVFILFASSIGYDKRRDKGDGLFYSPLFIALGVTIVGILFILWGVYNIKLDGSLPDNLNSALSILFGIGSVIYAIVSYKRGRRENGK